MDALQIKIPENKEKIWRNLDEKETKALKERVEKWREDEKALANKLIQKGIFLSLF